jgi:hypothetical protein
MVTPKGTMSTEGETPSFCPILQLLDMSTLGDAADINLVIKSLPRDLPQLRRRIVEAVAAIDRQMLQSVWQEPDYRIDISSTCKVGQKLGVYVSPSVGILLFGVTIPVTVPQRSEIPEGLMNYPVHIFTYEIFMTLY